MTLVMRKIAASMIIGFAAGTVGAAGAAAISAALPAEQPGLEGVVAAAPAAPASMRDTAQQYVYEGRITAEDGEVQEVEFSTMECRDWMYGPLCTERAQLVVRRQNGATVTYTDHDFDMGLDVLLIDGQRFDASTPLGQELLAVGQGQFEGYLTRIIEARTGWALERLGADGAEE